MKTSRPNHARVPLWALAVVVSLLLGVAATAATYYVDPSAASNGTGTQASPYNTWAGITFAAGNTYLQKAGTTFANTVYVNAQGTSTAPILFGAYGTGAVPAINAGTSGGFLFDNAAYVQVTGFQITTPDCGGKFVNGSHNITMNGNTFTNCGIGVWFGTGTTNSGGANLIDGNTMTGMTYYGVAAAMGVNCISGSETVISNNTISNCQYHGIEISGNYYIIDHNTVYDVGKVSSGGCSAIHLYCGVNGTFANTAHFCIIRNNVCGNVHDVVAQDGNGIQLDQHCDSNQVYSNFCFYNDGQGIILYDASSSVVHDNTTLGNARDPRHRHVVKSEIALYESTTEHNVSNNALYNNVCLATASRNNTIVVSTASGLLNGNLIGDDHFYSTAGGNIYKWMTTQGSNLTTWNTVYAVGGGDDLFSNIPLVPDAQIVQYDYKFGVSQPLYSPPVLTIDGVSRTITGWSRTQGLGYR